jgi:hypothetical protein
LHSKREPIPCWNQQHLQFVLAFLIFNSEFITPKHTLSILFLVKQIPNTKSIYLNLKRNSFLKNFTETNLVFKPRPRWYFFHQLQHRYRVLNLVESAGHFSPVKKIYTDSIYLIWSCPELNFWHKICLELYQFLCVF